MSHAVYTFLMHCDTAKIENQKGKFLPLLQEEIIDIYNNYCHDYCDGNNWDQHLSFITKNGIIKEIYQNDERSPHQKMDFLIPNEQRWHDIIKQSLIASCLDLEIYDLNPFAPNKDILQEINQKTSDEIIDLIHQKVPKKISESYQKIIGTHKDTDFLDSYRRSQQVKKYEFFRKSEIQPFSTKLSTPYDYRHYHLNSYEDEDPNVIFLVDIHT